VGRYGYRCNQDDCVHAHASMNVFVSMDVFVSRTYCPAVYHGRSFNTQDSSVTSTCRCAIAPRSRKVDEVGQFQRTTAGGKRRKAGQKGVREENFITKSSR